SGQQKERGGEKGLGDGPAPVWGPGMGRRPSHLAATAGPYDLAVAGKTGGHGRQPLTCLIAGESDVEQASRPVFDHGALGYRRLTARSAPICPGPKAVN